MRDDIAIFETLHRLGINRSQAKLYLLFLETGPATIASMARELNTSRQAIYLLLPPLSERGLIKEIHQGKRSLYQALPPTQLLGLVDDIKNRLDDIIPTLTNLQHTPSNVPLVTIYDNPLSMREWYRHFLETAQEGDEFLLYNTADSANWYKLDPEFYENYMQQQIKKKIKLLCLLPEHQKIGQFMQEVGKSISEYRYTSQAFSPNVEQWIWRDEVCYQTIQGNATNMIVLKSKPLADFSRKQFMEIWNAKAK